MAWLRAIIAWLFPKTAPVSPQEPPSAPIPTEPMPTVPPTIPESEQPSETAQLLYFRAYNLIGQDFTPNDEIEDKVACVAAVQELWRRTTGTYIGRGAALYNTGALYRELLSNPKWRKIDKPYRGCIVISPSGYSSKGAQHGHVGIWGNTHIMSNTSDTGKWEANFTHMGWKAYYAVKLGFPVYYFEPL